VRSGVPTAPQELAVLIGALAIQRLGAGPPFVNEAIGELAMRQLGARQQAEAEPLARPRPRVEAAPQLKVEPPPHYSYEHLAMPPVSSIEPKSKPVVN
jgi:hypothetical protein